MAAEPTLVWQYNDGYREAMVILVGCLLAKGQEPAGSPSLEVEYTLPKPGVKQSGAAGETITLRQTSKLGVAYVAACSPTDNCVGAMYGSFEQRYFVGTIKMLVRWQDTSGTAHAPEITIPATNYVNQPTEVSVGQVEAELTETLVSATVAEEEGATTTTYATGLADDERAKLVGDILVHLEVALERGLGALWRRVDPKGCCEADQVNALRDHDFTTTGLPREQLLECWAQHASELLIGGPYMGTAANMGVPPVTDLPGVHPSHARDAYLARKCVEGTRLLVPLMFQCQQLATMTLLCLGLDDIAQDPLDSHDVTHGNLSGNATATTASDLADWTEGGWPSAKKAVERKLVRVGTCYYYYNDRATPNDTSDDFPHVAAVLRVGRTPPRIQLIDTGGWLGDPRGRLRARTGGGGYMYDTAWVSGFSKSLPTVFTGVMQPPVVADSDLISAIERMRTARMLGAVRLVVKQRATPGDVWWVSQLLPMERDGKPYSLARLMAALRGCPHRQDMEVSWQVVMPQFAPAMDNCLDGQDGWWATGTLFPVAAISVDADGRPFFSWKNGDAATGAFRARRGTDASPFTLDATALASLRTSTGWSKFVDMTSQATRVGAYFNRS
jgi:hypothetical protein